MPRVLILSSFVAASRVGGGAQTLALARLGIEPILVPTVLYGRHPGHGPPGGQAVEPETFQSILDGVEAQGAFAGLDAVITGHFSSAEQVAIAVEALARARTASPAVRVVVDPIMGDADKGLYVREPVAEAIAAELVPVADLVAPNAWELARLSGREITDPASATAAARSLGRPALVSSVAADGQIGVVWVSKDEAWLATHARRPNAPKGTGDLLTAIFVAALTDARAPPEALETAVGVVADGVAAAEAARVDELPLASTPTLLGLSRRVRLRPLDV